LERAKVKIFLVFSPKFILPLSSNRGLSIIEILVSLVLITIGILGFGMAIPLGENNINKMKEERIALFLAKQMLEEIQSKGYEDPDLPSGSFGREESLPRDNFDDLDDYDNWNQSPPQRADGTLLNGQNGTPDYRNFRRKVVVENVADNDYSMVMDKGTTYSKRIIVTVSSEKTPPSFPDVVIKWVATREGMELLYGENR